LPLENRKRETAGRGGKRLSWARKGRASVPEGGWWFSDLKTRRKKKKSKDPLIPKGTVPSCQEGPEALEKRRETRDGLSVKPRFLRDGPEKEL